jgi:hypothetical protein
LLSSRPIGGDVLVVVNQLRFGRRLFDISDRENQRVRQVLVFGCIPGI